MSELAALNCCRSVLDRKVAPTHIVVNMIDGIEDLGAAAPASAARAPSACQWQFGTTLLERERRSLIASRSSILQIKVRYRKVASAGDYCSHQ